MWPIDGTLIDTTNPDQSLTRSSELIGPKVVFRTPQNSRNWASPPDAIYCRIQNKSLAGCELLQLNTGFCRRILNPVNGATDDECNYVTEECPWCSG